MKKKILELGKKRAQLFYFSTVKVVTRKAISFETLSPEAPLSLSFEKRLYKRKSSPGRKKTLEQLRPPPGSPGSSDEIVLE